MTLDDLFRGLLREEVRAVVREELGSHRVAEPVATPPAPSVLLTVVDVAARCRAAEQTVRAWIRSGELTAARPGKSYLVRPVDLERFLAGRVRAESGGAPSVETETARILSTVR